jgi:hypothetical protein
MRLAAFPGYAVERSAGTRDGVELVVCRTVRYRHQPEGRTFRRVQAVVGRTPDARAAVDAEIALATRCAGPGILPILDAADGAYLSPLLSPETLGDRLAAGTIGPEAIRRVSACLRSAVLSLHDADRAHGRIGPEAVRFTEDGEPVLVGLRTTLPLTAGGRSRDLRALDALRAELGLAHPDGRAPAEPPDGPTASRAERPDGRSTISAGPADAAPTPRAAPSPSADPAATVLRELAGRRTARRPGTGQTAGAGTRRHRSRGPVALLPSARVRAAAAAGIVAVAGSAAVLAAAVGPGTAVEDGTGAADQPVSATAGAGPGAAPSAAPASAAGDAVPDDGARTLVQELIDARTAWVSGAAAHDAATVPGSRAAEDDAALRRAWADAELRDWRVSVLEASVPKGALAASEDGARAAVDARIRESAARATDADGAGWEVPATGVYSATIIVQRIDGEWRIVEVTTS